MFVSFYFLSPIKHTSFPFAWNSLFCMVLRDTDSHASNNGSQMRTFFFHCFLEARGLACFPLTQDLTFLRNISKTAWPFGACPQGPRDGQQQGFHVYPCQELLLLPPFAYSCSSSSTTFERPICSFHIPSLPKLASAAPSDPDHRPWVRVA